MWISKKLGKLAIAAAIPISLVAGATFAGNAGDTFCSRTAEAQFEACKNETTDDFFSDRAKCINVSDNQQRNQCFADASTAKKADKKLCREQRVARKQLCGALGEDRYDPDFNPANFDDNFTNLTTPNPYRPLGIGDQWKFVGSDETIVVDVHNETKLIEGVTCLVVRDVVSKNGELIEDTNDWFAQDKNGDVFYCGEEVKDYESFTGDNPKLPELFDISGSFKHGRNGDKGGIFFRMLQTQGEVFRQEFSAGNAEDVVQVLSTNYGFGSDPKLDEFIPQALATLLCAANDCVVTGEFSPIHPAPDGFARKYYARGIGVFFEVVPTTGKIVQLVECNMDSKCAGLPAP